MNIKKKVSVPIDYALAVPPEEQKKYALLLKEAEAAEQYSAEG